jgi:hypothetical protein
MNFDGRSPHTVPGIATAFSRYEQTPSESSASVTSMIKPASALKSARSSAPTTGHLPQIVGLIRLETRILKEGQRARRANWSLCGWVFREMAGEEPVVFKSNYVRDFECNAVPGGGCRVIER